MNEVFSPLWGDFDAHSNDGVHIKPEWELAAQPAADFDADQRISG